MRPLTQEFADAVNEICKRTGTLLIADEVQCGLGRTGQPFYFQKLGMNPDLVPVGNFYRHLEAKLDLGFVGGVVQHHQQAPLGQPGLDRRR